MERYLELIRAGEGEPRVIDPATVVTAAWTVYKCQFGCGSYGRNHCCPPEAPDYLRTRAILDEYRTAILFRCRHWGTTALAVKTARELFLDGYYKVLAFGSGPCKLCPSCDPAGCRRPGEAVPSMEASGIDVFATARANGFSIRTLREVGEERSHFGLLLVE